MESISRRKFIQLSSATGSFLVLGYLPTLSGNEKLIAKSVSNPSEISLNQFISIGSDNSIVLFNHRPEMGQGTYQSIPMILAEELEVDVDEVIIKPSIANVKLYGSQMVVGSRSIQTEFEKLRKMGAAAREMLRQAAAAKWNVDIKACKATRGTVVNASGATFMYGQLVQEASKISPPENPPLKSRKEFTVIGKPVARKDIPSKVNGDAKFGIDITVPGMLYGSIERSPVFLGKVIGFNRDEVLEMPGVRHVLKTSREVYGHKREGVAVLADSYWQALQGRMALKVEWDNQGLETVSSDGILKNYYEAAKNEGDELFSKGDTSAAFTTSAKVVAFSYETPYQAHVCMEPMNAIVHVTDTEASYWGSTQNPNGIRTYLAKTYQLPEDKININYTFMGGGFGRRSMTDVAEEAADLSKKSGAPVKVMWTREEDLTQDPLGRVALTFAELHLIMLET